MNTLATLYDLTDTMRHLLDLAQTGEVDQQVIEETIESMDLTNDIERKIEGYAIVMDELKASNERIRNEEKRLAKRRRMQENNYNRMRETLLDQMKLIKINRIKTDKYTVSIRQNAPKLVVQDESEIPKAYWIEQPPKLDKRLLLNDLKLEDYPDFKGATVVQEESLQIR
jgi:hypothetical protein